MCYNASRILVAQHIVIPPQHRVCVMVNFTNSVCNEYVTSPRVTNKFIISSGVIHGGNGPVVMEIINNSNNQVVLRQGEPLTHVVEDG